MTTMEQAVDQIQQELVTVRAQIASRVHVSEAVHAADNLTTVQAQEDPPSTTDVNSRDRLKEFSGRGEDFQQWARTTESERLQKESWREKPGGKYARTESLRESESKR